MNPLALSLLLPMAAAAPQGPPVGCPPVVVPGLHGPVVTQACPPLGPPAPLLAARVLAPAGVKVTVLPGGPLGRTFDAPVNLGFRPGYAYRLELSNIPGYPGVSLYPSLEVRGSLVPRPGMDFREFPAPVYVSVGDIERVMHGGMVTKAVYLEDPTKAEPVQSRADMPIELGEPTEEAALKAAMDNGRLVAVLRIGDRKPDPEELTKFAAAGTVLFPGETSLGVPAVMPYLPTYGVPLYDPAIGPKPATEECFVDGGDVGPRIGVGPGGRVGGLNPTDVALEYTRADGKRRVAGSNAVCICSPRYVTRRVDVLPGGLRSNAALDAVANVVSRSVASGNTPPMAVANRVKPVGYVTGMRAAITVSRNGVHTFIGVSGPQAVASVSGVRAVLAVVEVDEITSYPNEVAVTKSVSPTGPVQPGDVVTFTIRYHNGTRGPATDLMLSDSLSGRLEYVAGSAKSDRPTNVTTVDNEAGSAIVRFEIPGPIPAGQSGMVTFQARVR